MIMGEEEQKQIDLTRMAIGKEEQKQIDLTWMTKGKEEQKQKRSIILIARRYGVVVVDQLSRSTRIQRCSS